MFLGRELKVRLLTPITSNRFPKGINRTPKACLVIIESRNRALGNKP